MNKLNINDNFIKNAVSGSEIDCLEPYELEFIEFLITDDFEKNNKDFSTQKIKKVELLIKKINLLRLQ